MAEKPICSIPDCGKPTVARSLCRHHYGRWWGANRQHKPCQVDGCKNHRRGSKFCSPHDHRYRRYGDPLGGGAYHGESDKYFFEVVLNHDIDQCLPWPFGRSSGYGVWYPNGGNRRFVHRDVCEYRCGIPPSDKHEAAHSCGNGHHGCCAPMHLSWKTPKENNKDKILHGTLALGDKNPAAKLSEAQVREIRSLTGLAKVREVAVKFGVSPSLVSMIQRRTAWTWLD
jgi:hypothetical protein